ncbi:unnamed protein product [Phyllotreta striolata]|uniref:Topoisomerase 6 subunit A/Spo11 TOPRIM domain-containing protein n=1 Tax=Phyllotreta striolata TaxID=444603 RepID=A0A9N9TEN8_PHYSR|nr:unnamed protein product [Phyllotreta striolata]
MSIPVFILVDGDPHGIEIMLKYRYGSVNTAHVSHELAVPNARWIGIYPSEMKEFDVQTQELTAKELSLLKRLINGPYAANSAILKELKIMLESRRKAGIEALMMTPVFLSEVYLPFKFCTNEFK